MGLSAGVRNQRETLSRERRSLRNPTVLPVGTVDLRHSIYPSVSMGGRGR